MLHGGQIFLFLASSAAVRIYFRKQKIMRKLLVISVFLLALANASAVRAQNMHLATNLLDYANFGTINAEFGLSPSPKWSFYIKGRYNPFTFHINGQKQNRVASCAVGSKYWFWYSNSGWFLNTNIVYSIYNTGGIIDEYAYEGDSYGLSVGGGYALMLNKRWNLDFGFGVQGGFANYTMYACPRCGKVEKNGNRFYVVPGALMIQLSRIL